ncbi:MAG TPA: enoyl-CoA hydratase-related protein [Allosphingosinicella sp.]|jgi:enoyl-CoA hydratase/carnithine racemase
MFELETEGPIATLRLRRPETRNAIPLEGWAALADRAGEAAQGGARALILAGEPGGAFCAGADLASFDAFRDDPQARTGFRLAIRNGLDRFRDVPIPTIAVVEGAAYGAGVAVAMACDIRISGPGARFAVTPAKLGISYPQEDVHRLVSLVGPGQAARLMFGTQPIDGSEAERIGLVELHSTDAPAAARDLAQAIAANAPQSLRTLKRGIALAAAGAARDEEQDRVFDHLLGSDALFDRLAAHRSRRS